LAQYFDVIIGAETGQPKKPDGAPLLACISALGGGIENALFVGDCEIDYQTAMNARAHFRLFSGGYLRTMLPDLGQSDRFDDWNASGF